MTEEQYHEYIANLETVCEMCRVTILYGGQLNPHLVSKAREELRKTEAQIDSLRQRYEKPTQAE